MPQPTWRIAYLGDGRVAYSICVAAGSFLMSIPEIIAVALPSIGLADPSCKGANRD